MFIVLNAVKLLKAKLGSVTKSAFSQKYLLYTNVGISVSLSGLGDVLEQHYEIITDELDEWDSTRTKRMSISGMTVGLICHCWYNFLDRKLPGKTVSVVAKKVIADQFVGSPAYISVFFVTLAYLEGKTYEDFIEEVKQKAWRLYAAEWIVWPPAQIINFYFLPNKFRVLYDSTISLGYDVYTSYVKHSIPGENS